MRRIVEHVDVGEADDGDDEEAKRHGEEGWGQSPGEAVRDGQMSSLELRD